MKRRFSWSFFFAELICLNGRADDPGFSPHPAPYVASTSVVALNWHWDTYKTAAPGSDLWPITWGPDDDLYTAWGDGGGFGGSDTDSRVSLGFGKIEGAPEHFRGININGGKSPLHPASFPKKGKTVGMLCVGATLYALLNLQDGRWPEINHAVAWSEDHGATWTKAKHRWPGGERHFEPAKFLNFGPGYTEVPTQLAGFIYLVGPKFESSPTGRGNSLYLARVPRDKIRAADALEFFAGTGSDEKPLWKSGFEFSHPIFTDANGVSPGAIAYDRGLNRFLLSCFHSGPGQLGVFEALEPWGPWRTVAYYENWGKMTRSGSGLSCEFPSKWISADGRTLWCVFSAYGEGAKKGINAHDRFNLVQVTLTTN